ncbi:MAG: gamma-glutamylcyclotransferase family protein [Oleiphilaceae bacterium]|nr:gamma-glutamylcyclotransferase family protein [Oleiphilaceae bacterium]
MSGKRRLLWLLTGSGGLLLALAFYLWLILLSPFGYEPPEQSVALQEGQHHGLFVYGTLRNPLVRLLVTGQWVESTPARVQGYRREGLNLVPDDDASVAGELLWIQTDTLQRLDRYERLGERYQRRRLPPEQTSIEGTAPEAYTGEPVWFYQRL